MNPLAEKYLRKAALPLIFCPGCGDGTVLNVFLRAVEEMGIFAELALVGGFAVPDGCPPTSRPMFSMSCTAGPFLLPAG